jgi:hypothetical protein
MRKVTVVGDEVYAVANMLSSHAEKPFDGVKPEWDKSIDYVMHMISQVIRSTCIVSSCLSRASSAVSMPPYLAFRSRSVLARIPCLRASSRRRHAGVVLVEDSDELGFGEATFSQRKIS